MTAAEVCSVCPTGMSSPSGSDELVDCKCKVGHFNETSDEATCRRCETGTYKNYTGTGTCVACPAAFTTSEPGSGKLADCKCAAGYTIASSDGATCAACEPGTYKAEMGQESCTYCDTVTSQTGTHSPKPGAHKCLNCPDENQDSSSITCYCKPDYIIDIQNGGCIFSYQTASTLELSVYIGSESNVGFSGNAVNTGKQGAFIASVSRGFSVARKQVTITGIKNVQGTPSRRLLAIVGVNVAIAIRASREQTEFIILLVTSGEFKLDYPDAVVTLLTVVPDVDSPIVVYSPPLKTQTTTTPDPVIIETPIPIPTTSSSLPIETIVIIAVSGVFGIGVFCVCAICRRSSKHKIHHHETFQSRLNQDVSEANSYYKYPCASTATTRETVSLDVSNFPFKAKRVHGSTTQTVNWSVFRV
jgi:hypothetical protein